MPRADQGVASALNDDVTRELGTARRVALLGPLLAGGYRAAIGDKLAGMPHGTADTAREGIANALEAAPTTGGDASHLVEAARQAFVDGWQQSMWAGVAVMTALLVRGALRGPSGNAAAHPAGDDPAPGAPSAHDATVR
ncbi:hypothetical protein [Streptomyces sp. SS1-1]|uniref:hypothetical protein n=1 Tax=Streptomyces sp. SS1-1 TaxID=2651869 RepID=UPI0039A5B0DF